MKNQTLLNLQMLQQTINAMVEQEQRVSNLEAEVREIKAQIIKNQRTTLRRKNHDKNVIIHLKLS